MLVSVDPGLHACGVAAWGEEDKLLKWAGYVKTYEKQDVLSVKVVDAVEDALLERFGHDTYDELVIELPVVYTRTRSKGDPNDLIALAFVVGAFAERYEVNKSKGFTLYKPFEWKKHQPKEITELRARKTLTEAELAVVELPTARSLQHNVFDSIGLGLFHLGRR